MSEFQLYSFKSIDRPLTKDERATIASWSSRADVTASGAHFVYNYGDFRQNMESVTAQYFDAAFYWANFGCCKLIFRFPKKSLNADAIKPYLFSDNIELRTVGDYYLLIFDESVDNGGYEYYLENEDVLDDLIALRQDIMQGDYRALYLMWLYFHSPNFEGHVDYDKYYAKAIGDELSDLVDFDEDDEDDEDTSWYPFVKEPPVPAGLNKLSSALQELVDLFQMDEDWIASAATASKSKQKATHFDAKIAIANLTEAERNDFLLRLANNEQSLAQIFQQKLHASSPTSNSDSNTARRTIREIADGLNAAEQNRLNAEKLAAQAALKKRCDDLAKVEGKTWDAVRSELTRQVGSSYDFATKKLAALKELAEYRGSLPDFQAKFKELCLPAALKSTALRTRFVKAKLM